MTDISKIGQQLRHLDPSKTGQIETSESEVRILMLKGQDGEWLLDGLAVDTPSR